MTGQGNDDFQRRLLLTMIIAAAIVFLWPMIFPPTPRPIAGEGETTTAADAAATTGGDSATDPAKGPDAPPEPPLADPGPLAPEHPVVAHTLRNDELAVTLTNAGAGLLSGVEPLDPHFEKDGGGGGIDFMRLEGMRSLEVGLGGDVVWSSPRGLEVLHADDRHFSVRARSQEVAIDQHFELLEGKEAKLTIEVTNTAEVARAHSLRMTAMRGQAETKDSYDVLYTVCRAGGKIQRWDEGDFKASPERFDAASWVATDSKYFTQAVVPIGGDWTCELFEAEEGRIVTAVVEGPKVTLATGERRTYELGVYVGAKVEEDLQAFSLAPDAKLEEVIDWGWFRVVSRFFGIMMLQLLRLFHNLTGVWGLAIVLLTLVVKLLLLPLTVRQMKSMRKMKAIQPQLNEINAKYKDDVTKRNQEIQALMAREGANPFSGCVPLLLQLPIWWALYTMLSVSVDLYREPFLWVSDLTKHDPWFIFPLGLGLLQFVQARIQPAPADNEQARMMQWTLPVVFTVMMLFLPAGLNVYIFANSALSLLQSWIMLRDPSSPAAPALPPKTA